MNTKIIFNKLIIANLLSFGSSKTIIDIKSGLNLIVGQNGTGKSAIFDIIILSLWGDIIDSKKCPSLSGSIINHNCNNASSIIIIKRTKK